MDLVQDERLRPLARLVGDWDTTVVHLSPDGSESETTRARDIFRWSQNGMFLHHDVDMKMDGARLRSTEIFALNPDGPGFVSRAYEPDGTFGDYLCLIETTPEGEEIALTGEIHRFAGMHSRAQDTISGSWEQRDAQGDWQPFMRVHLRRRGSR